MRNKKKIQKFIGLIHKITAYENEVPSKNQKIQQKSDLMQQQVYTKHISKTLVTKIFNIIKKHNLFYMIQKYL
jgi:hypothetical protein